MKATTFVSCLLRKLCCTEIRMVREERSNQGFLEKSMLPQPTFHSDYSNDNVQGGEAGKDIKMTLMPLINYLMNANISHKILIPFARRKNETRQMRKCVSFGGVILESSYMTVHLLLIFCLLAQYSQKEEGK